MSYVLINHIDDSATLVVASRKHGMFNVPIDVEEADRVAELSWAVQKLGSIIYFCTTLKDTEGRETTLSLHRFILNAPTGSLVDHRNPADTLDTRKSNLRFATFEGNNRNRRSRPGSSSKYKGVSWCKSRNKFQVSIRVNGGYKTIGRYTSEVEAAHAYYDAARKYYADFAYLNFPDS